MDERPNPEVSVTEIPAAEAAQGEAKPQGSGAAGANRPTGTTLKDAFNALSKVLGMALEDRTNVVMVRVNDEALRHLDMLVDAEVTKSRSESAALLIAEGIKANQTVFDKISEITEQINALRAQLHGAVSQSPFSAEAKEE